MNKKIILNEIYAEPGINFDEIYKYQTAETLMQNLNNSFFEDGLLLTKYPGYQLNIILTTKSKKLADISLDLYKPVKVTENFILCKPIISKSKKWIEFTVYLPYLNTVNEKTGLDILLSNFSLALKNLLNYLEYKQENIDKIISSVKI